MNPTWLKLTNKFSLIRFCMNKLISAPLVISVIKRRGEEIIKNEKIFKYDLSRELIDLSIFKTEIKVF